jgi:inositol 1,4,5-triphosphate receptor type 1/inositol 1,4,5-triphosphate receptor type 3
MQDQTLVNINLKSQEGNYFYIFLEDTKNSGIMQDIYMMSEIIKNEHNMTEVKKNAIKTIQTSGMYDKLGTNLLLNFTDERTSSNCMKQSVLDAENIHLKVLTFILNCREIPTETLALKLLHLSYKFMASLIWNFQTIKPSLINIVPQISHHLLKNVGCIDFLKEMYDNNKTMLFNDVNVLKLIKLICGAIEQEGDNSFYKSKLLDFFRFLIYCNGKSLKSNQVTILKIMQDDSYKSIILNITDQLIDQLTTEYQQEYDKV